MKKLLIFVTTLLLVIGASAIVAPCWGQNIDVEEDQTEMDDDGGCGGGEITCSAGSTGRCFRYIEAQTIVPLYDCEWTGKQSDNCNALGGALRLLRDWIL